MLLSRCLSSTSALLLLAGCPGDDAVCGFGDAPVDGIVVAGDGQTFEYGGFLASAANDCRSDEAPDGVVSVTVFGSQVDPAGSAFVSFCLPRPDLLEGGTEYPLRPDDPDVPSGDRIQVIDVDADHPDDCTWSVAGEPSGTASFEGLCGDGVDPAGFALTVEGAITVQETCGADPPVDVEVTLTGTVRVLPQ